MLEISAFLSILKVFKTFIKPLAVGSLGLCSYILPCQGKRGDIDFRVFEYLNFVYTKTGQEGSGSYHLLGVVRIIPLPAWKV
jgi:hypothetical protein